MYKYRETTKDTNNDDFYSLRFFRFGNWTISGHFWSLAGRTDRSPYSRKKIYQWWASWGNRDICIRSRKKRKTKDIRNTRAKRQNSSRHWWISSDQHALSLIVYLDGPPSAIPLSLLSVASAVPSPANSQSAARTAEFTRDSVMKFCNNYSCANFKPHAITP